MNDGHLSELLRSKPPSVSEVLLWLKPSALIFSRLPGPAAAAGVAVGRRTDSAGLPEQGSSQRV